MSDEAQVDDPVWGDWGHSLYNDNGGIDIRFSFYHLPIPGVRRHANARAPSINKVLTMYEDYSMQDFFVLCSQSIDRLDLLDFSRLYSNDPNQELNSFTVKYDIVGSSIKGIDIARESDFIKMVEAVKRRAKPALNIDWIEIQIHRLNGAFQLPQDEDDDEDERQQADPEPDGSEPEEEVDSRPRKRPRNNSGSNNEEDDQDEKIIQLKDAHICSDHKCPNYTNFCLLIGPEADHLFLLPQHFCIWSAAWCAKIPGVDEETPPNNQIFDSGQPPNTNNTDINLLDSCRTRHSTSSSGSHHGLSDAIHQKLHAMNIAGPHTLRLMLDSDLFDGGLSKGQIATTGIDSVILGSLIKKEETCWRILAYLSNIIGSFGSVNGGKGDWKKTVNHQEFAVFIEEHEANHWMKLRCNNASSGTKRWIVDKELSPHLCHKT
ncbi:hypothetical protein C8J56DRAFT_1086003 [Mycena floridula]|nr:hypothetical protein C8J56DRAFT_1086003 [Mycena floridula]